MAKMTLPTNFLDDIMSASMNGKRQYEMINNPNGTVSLVDVTEYDQVGSVFGSAQINHTNTAVNELGDNLGGCSLEQEGEDFYIVGADSVRKKLGSPTVSITTMNVSVSANTTSQNINVGAGYYAAYIINFSATYTNSIGSAETEKYTFSQSYNSTSGILTYKNTAPRSGTGSATIVMISVK